VKTQTQFSKKQVTMFLAKDAAADILEPLVDSLLANGLVHAALTESAKRSLKIFLSDDGVKLSVAEFNAEAEGIAKTLVGRLTVKDPARVPPVVEKSVLNVRPRCTPVPGSHHALVRTGTPHDRNGSRTSVSLAGSI
jgi:hypothetical protein